MVTAIVTILIFLVLISLHEFGHFIMAKLTGVSVLEFSVGMGPAIFKKQGKETLYSLRALPIGGYCKLLGEDEKSDSEAAFSNQKLWKRILVVVAGAILNIVLGYVIFVLIVGLQKTITTTTIDSVDQRAYIAESGIKTGDRIVRINGQDINFYNDIAFSLGSVSPDKEIDVTVKRNGEELKFSILPSLEERVIAYDGEGAKITTTVNGETDHSYLTFSDEEKEAFLDLKGKEEKTTRYILGFVPGREKVTLTNIFSEAYHYTVFVIKVVYNALVELVTGKVGIEQFSGPVGVAAAVDSAVKSKQYSLLNLLNLVSMLTINLGIFNLLPLPALDGGRLFFLLIELVIGKRVPQDKEGLVHTIGMLLLLAFAAVVLFNDIVRLL